jgi:hypothetical protein
MNQIPIFGVEASLPHVCGGLSFREVGIFQDPHLGAAIRYEGSAGRRADAYLYNLGLSDIPNDLQSSDVQEFFQQAWEDILRVVEKTKKLDLEILKHEFLYLPEDAPDPFCILVAFTYLNYTGRQISYLTLRIDRGFINKIRYTYPDIEGSEEKQYHNFLVFLKEWTIAVQEFSNTAVD